MNHLRRRWLLVAASWTGALLLSHWWLQHAWPAYSGYGAALAGLVLAYGLWVVWRSLPENHRPYETALLPTLGPGNGLTLLRGLAIGLLAAFLFSPWPGGWLGWLPMLLYTTADVADYLDGYLARITNHITVLGARLDMEFDGLGLVVVSLLAVWYGQLPWWYLILGFARYLFVFGLWWRQRQGRPVYDIPPSVHRRVFAGFQMGFMSAVLWPILPAAGATIAGTVFAAATALSFTRDWLVASGRLDPASTAYHEWQRRLYLAASRWFPLLCRLVVMITMITIIRALPALWPPPAWAELVASWGLPLPAAVAGLVSAIAVVATVAVALGAMGRTTAFLLVFPIGFDIVTQAPAWSNGTALAGAVCLMLWGTGAFSLWQPEARYLMQPAGEQPPAAVAERGR